MRLGIYFPKKYQKKIIFTKQSSWAVTVSVNFVVLIQQKYEVVI